MRVHRLLGLVPLLVACAADDGTDAAELAIDPGAPDFGEVRAGANEHPQLLLRVVNLGVDDALVDEVALQGAGSGWLTVYTPNAMPFTLGGSAVMDVVVAIDRLPAGADLGSYEPDLVVSGFEGDGHGELDVAVLERSVTFTVVEGCDFDGDGHLSIECDGQDCDDANPDVHPDALEVCNGFDDNCDGAIDDLEDADNDGFTICDDCDDRLPDVFPGAPELCNGRDDDCDGRVVGESDGDRDGVRVCDGDCDDGEGTVYPGAGELCDGLDNDCNGLIDDGTYEDRDADGWDSCLGDCDDNNPNIHPGADEVCNGLDDNCDGVVPAIERDLDGDGESFCEGDCDPLDPSVFTGAPELCDGLDNDCDGAIPVAEADGDGDGVRICDGDCDDDDDTSLPGGTEVCDGADNDCNGVIDDGAIDAITWWPDDDGDGYGDADTASRTTCDVPTGAVTDGTDCDDTDPDINPGETEVCDTLDNDCSGLQDDGGVCPCDVEYSSDGDVYMFCQYDAEWDLARRACLAFDYHLTTIDDATEDNWVWSLTYSYASSDKWWMGYNDIDTEGTFEWVDGSSATYTNWRSGEPNDSGGEDCAQLNRYGTDEWNDEPCSYELYFVCEAD